MSNQWTKVYRDGKWKSIKTDGTMNLVMTIGPVLAQRWLDNRNHHNRKRKEAQIGKIARDIERGKWVDTGNYISFYRDGELHDGQNRLAAIVKSGRQVKTRVVFGIEKDAVAVTDIGVKRSLVDRATLAGFEVEGKALRAARFVIEMLKRCNKVYDDEVIDFYSQYKNAFDRVAEVINTKWISKQPVHGAMALVGIQEPDKIENVVDFAKKYNSGIGIINETHPALKLRNFAMDHRQSNSGAWRTELFLKTLFACRAYLDGNRKINRLYRANEDTVFVEDFALTV